MRKKYDTFCRIIQEGLSVRYNLVLSHVYLNPSPGNCDINSGNCYTAHFYPFIAQTNIINTSQHKWFRTQMCLAIEIKSALHVTLFRNTAVDFTLCSPICTTWVLFYGPANGVVGQVKLWLANNSFLFVIFILLISPMPLTDLEFYFRHMAT